MSDRTLSNLSSVAEYNHITHPKRSSSVKTGFVSESSSVSYSEYGSASRYGAAGVLFVFVLFVCFSLIVSLETNKQTNTVLDNEELASVGYSEAELNPVCSCLRTVSCANSEALIAIQNCDQYLTSETGYEMPDAARAVQSQTASSDGYQEPDPSSARDCSGYEEPEPAVTAAVPPALSAESGYEEPAAQASSITPSSSHTTTNSNDGYEEPTSSSRTATNSNDGYEEPTSAASSGAPRARAGGDVGYEMPAANAKLPPRSIAAPLPPSSERFLSLFDRLSNTFDPLSGVTTNRDWNDEWQDALALPDSKVKFARLRDLELDFVHTASLYGKIIISELALPVHNKTIRPIAVGGIAGGEKYIVQNILFKFAVDVEGLYKSDENAMKAASHDLNGLMAYHHAGIGAIHLPLMALIDYLGFRLQAISILPISKHTICYGSADGARTVHKSNATLNALMEDAAQVLNIKVFVFYFSLFLPFLFFLLFYFSLCFLSFSKRKKLTSFFFVPAKCDSLIVLGQKKFSFILSPILRCLIRCSFFAICAHILTATVSACAWIARGILDLMSDSICWTLLELRPRSQSRKTIQVRRSCCSSLILAPHAQARLCRTGGSILYRLLRPEFVQRYAKPLSNDAFSAMGRHNAKEHNNEIRDAYRSLLGEVLPAWTEKFVARTTERLEKAGDELQPQLGLLNELAAMLHAGGLNVRLLGHIRQHVPVDCAHLRALLLTEAVARVAKNSARALQRRETRRTGVPASERFHSLLLHFLNMLLQPIGAAESFWADLEAQAEFKFAGLFLSNSKADGGEAPPLPRAQMGNVPHRLLFYRVVALLAIDIDARALAQLDSALRSQTLAESAGFQLVQPDLLSQRARLKHLGLVAYADAMQLYHTALEATDADARQRLLEVTRAKLEEAQLSLVSNQMATFHLARTLQLMAKDATRDSDRSALLERAAAVYTALRAERIEPNLNAAIVAAVAAIERERVQLELPARHKTTGVRASLARHSTSAVKKCMSAVDDAITATKLATQLNEADRDAHYALARVFALTFVFNCFLFFCFVFLSINCFPIRSL